MSFLPNPKRLRIAAAAALCCCAGLASAQVVVNLTAARQMALMPDGTAVPMWGWTCANSAANGAASTAVAGNGTCGTLAGAVQSGTGAWQPPLITVPAGSALTINLANTLPVETSLTVVGQFNGGGLGSPVREAGPRTDGAHGGQTSTTWVAVTPAAVPFTPPAQANRIRSFVPEAAAGSGTQSYVWPAYNAASGAGLKPGTYLIESGTYPSLQGPMGLYGVLVVTTAPVSGAGATPGIAYSGNVLTGAPAQTMPYGIQYDADVPLLLSEIDPVQNQSVEHVLEVEAACPANTGACAGSVPAAVETAKWNPACAASTVKGTSCYPPFVDYTPTYFLVNGSPFDQTSTASGTTPVPGAATTGNVLLRFVNAGLRMHVPSVVGLPMALVAEDGNVVSDVKLQAAREGAAGYAYNARTQNEVFLAAGKSFDVIVNPARASGAASGYAPSNVAVFDRQLSLSGNGVQQNTGMQALVLVNGGSAGTGLVTPIASKAAYPDSFLVPPGATTFSANVLTNDVGINNASTAPCAATSTGPQNIATALGGNVVLNPNGVFIYTPISPLTSGATDTFSYCGDASYTALVTLTGAAVGAAPTANPDAYTSNVSGLLIVAPPGVLANDSDPSGYALTAVLGPVSAGLSVSLASDGGFTATVAAPPASGTASYTFQYTARNAQGTSSAATTVSLVFQAGSGLQVVAQDAQTKAPITDYKWIIEQDLTFNVDPACQQNGAGGNKPATCPTGIVPTLGTNFHTSYMPVVASGCTGAQSCERGQSVFDPVSGSHIAAACDGFGNCTAGLAQLPATLPSQVNLPTTDAYGRPARYYLSLLPGDAANAFNTGNGLDPSVAGNCTTKQTPTGQSVNSCGHTMGGAPIAPGQASVTVNLEPNPLNTAQVTAFVFEDDFPLNGEPDTGGGVDTYPTQEVGLGDFQIELWDIAGSVSADPTGQMTYDVFNQPLTNALNGTIDPLTGLDACPISNTGGVAIGTIIVCPKYESDGVTLSPLVGNAVIKNLMPGLFDVVAHPGAAREARGEEWLQTNTLDGSHLQEAFIKVHEPAYFQEYGPGGYHVFFGEANPALINSRLAQMCGSPGAPACNNTVQVQVANLHQARSPDERLFTSNVFPFGDGRNYAPLNYTTCYGALGDTDGATFALQKCDENGNVTFTHIPDGNWGLVVFDQWDDLIVDGSSRAVNLSTGGKGGVTQLTYGSFTWQTHLWTRTFLDTNGNGIQDPGEAGLIQVPSRIRMRNGKPNNSLLTDSSGNAHFDETFPLFNWYVAESDTTRFKSTGVHVVNDAGGQLDGPAAGGGNGNSGPYQALLNSLEIFSLPPDLQAPGTVYCGVGDAACANSNLAVFPNGNAGSVGSCTAGGSPGTTTCTGLSTGRVDPGSVLTEAWQGGLSQFDLIEWGKQPYGVGENGGIRGHVVYSSTRPFDDPMILTQNIWEPLVPNVTINLYRQTTAPDGTASLTLIDTTQSSSWDGFTQGFGANGRPATQPNISCPGEDPNDPFYGYTLQGQQNYLQPGVVIPHGAQFKCYDGYHNLSQIQPAPYDGMYQFPSAACAVKAGATFTSPSTGQSLTCGTVPNPYAGSVGSTNAILPAGQYVVEVVPPPNYQIVKEEDKNILIGDAFIAPVTQQVNAMVNIFIVPDQASINSYNACYGTGAGCTNPTTNIGRTSFGGFNAGGMLDSGAPCVGKMRIVPDFMSISPESGQVAPFAGALRPLCDRKLVTLVDQTNAATDFFIWTKTPAASHYTGFVTDDFASEYDITNPAFGEKFAIPNLPIAIRDYNGVEISRVYSDQWGTFNGMVFSTWEVNPPNPTGYAPGVMVMCMNDPGPIVDTRAGSATFGQMITDPNFNPQYSDFCYEWTFMPADTAYLDTPVVPTTAFADGYNPVDCQYPDATPAVKEVDGDGIGPWVSAAGNTLTLTALGDQPVLNHAYSGPAATQAPYNLKFITRHYGFGSTAGTVSIAGVNATVTSWSDSSIQVKVPVIPAGASTCPLQQRNVPSGTSASRCGQLVITRGDNGRQSIDTVTVTVGGKAPKVLAAGQTIQSAIDAAAPGDLIMVPPGSYTEMLLMWKPVRLQGVAAASVIVNGNTQPAGKILEPWRRQVNCLFGLALDGGFINNKPNGQGQPTHPYDPSGTYTCAFYNTVTGGQITSQSLVDPIPLEPVVGWDASLNGNIAELLQEPTLLGAYEGASITVLAKGLENNNTAACNANDNTGCVPLNNTSDCSVRSPFYTGNYLCNPSRIDGMSFANSSQGGGGIFLHGWNHYTEVSNNRVYNNSGTLGGGIIVGQSETPPAVFDPSGLVQLPMRLNHHVYIHNNAVTSNTAYGDELNSNTPAAAGGITFCDGSDYYRFNYNWVCGNLSMGDGGGMAHFGFSYDGDIEHNSFLFNQSTNPTLTTYGGGLVVEGVGPDGTVCENSGTVDLDCPPELADGVGPGLVINANLFQGNTAESGMGGGLAFLHVNGTEVQRNPRNSGQWYSVQVTNNIIVNNVAGWAGGGVSLQDALLVNFTNNTVVSNDTTGTAGVLFDTTVAPNANNPPPNCDPTQPNGVPLPNGQPNNCSNTSITQSVYLPAGLETTPNSLLLRGVMSDTAVVCPNHPNCLNFSNPQLTNTIFWQNRAFRITTGAQGTAGITQTTVMIVPSLNQTATGMCPAAANYWDIGVYGDTGPGNHGSGLTMSPQYSILTDAADYPGANNRGGDPAMASQYCNGSRVPPEIASNLCTSNANAPGCIQPGTGGSIGITVPPGVPDAVYAGPAFTLTPAATVDEGNNWINMYYGPLSTVNATIQSGTAGYGTPLGSYVLTSGSAAIDAIPRGTVAYSAAPKTDFFGNPRPDPGHPNAVDIGAVEYVSAASTAQLAASPASLSFGPQLAGASSATQVVTVTNTGADATGVTYTMSGGGFVRSTGAAYCGATIGAGASCSIAVAFAPPVGLSGAASATLTVTPASGTGFSLALSGTAFQPVSPAALNFPNQGVGSTSGVQFVTLSNPGAAALTVSAITLGGGAGATQFLAPAPGGSCGATPITLAAGANCTVAVAFVPKSAGTKNATLTLRIAQSPQGANGYAVTLSGTGVQAAVTFADPALTTTPANRSTKTGVIQVTNSGTGPLTLLQDPSLSSNFANGVFTIVAPPSGTACAANLTLAAGGGSCGIGIQYVPNTGGTIGTTTATVNLYDSGASTPQQSTTIRAN